MRVEPLSPSERERIEQLIVMALLPWLMAGRSNQI